MTVREKMQAGKLYFDAGVDEGLPAERDRCRILVQEYNNSHPTNEKQRQELLTQILGDVGKEPYLEPPIHFAYGCRTHIGDYFYSNFNLTIVDDIDVYIGNYVMFAPNVTISATGHPVDPELRRGGRQFSLPVTIEDDVWLGAGVIIMPGITIGKGSVIGAGSVVTHNIPAGVVAVGNPCRILRPISEHDKEFYYRDRRVETESE